MPESRAFRPSRRSAYHLPLRVSLRTSAVALQIEPKRRRLARRMNLDTIDRVHSHVSDHLDFLRPPRRAEARPLEKALIFLDSRDLIDCFENADPIASRDFGGILRQKDARLVVTMTTLTEMFPGGAIPTEQEVERGIALAQQLDLVPHCFMRHATIPAREIRAAFEAWQHGDVNTVAMVDPFVSRFYETLWKPVTGTTDVLLRTDETEFLHRLPVWEQLRVLALHPESLRWNDKYATRATSALDADRATHGAKRGTREALECALARHLRAGGMSEPRNGLKHFAKWVRSMPAVCPGWRIGWDSWEEYRSDMNSRLRPSDLRDFSHLSIIPYVTHFTADAKWRDLLRRATQRRAKEGLASPYFDRVHADLSSILTAL
jgi:hypothetical protein